MAALTCITCRVAFRDAELQRAHYKTDWHRYNLRRKVAAMAPVTAEGFQERVRAASRRVELLNAKNLEKGLGADGVDKDAVNAAIQQAIKAQPSTSPKKAPFVPTDECGRAAAGARGVPERDPTEKPPRLQWFEQQAKKLAKQQWEDGEEEGEEEEEDDEDEDWEDIDSDDGLECEDPGVEDQDAEDAAAEESPPLGAIPITDCLFCSHHSSSLVKNVAHMTKVHSFFIPDIEYLSDLKGLIKYLGEKVGVGKICLWCNEKGKSFYSTEAVQAHMNDKSHCKLFTDGDAALEFADFYDFRSSYPDYKEGQDPAELEALSTDKILECDDETMELILPSGARVGHRSLMRYYKQRFGLPRAVTVARNQKAVGRVLQQYRALGWMGSTGAALMRERDMQYVQRMKSKWILHLF